MYSKSLSRNLFLVKRFSLQAFRLSNTILLQDNMFKKKFSLRLNCCYYNVIYKGIFAYNYVPKI